MRHFLWLLAALSLAAPSQAQQADHVFFPEGKDTCLVAQTPANPTSQASEVALVRRAEPDPISEEAAWDRHRRSQGLATEPHVSRVWAVVGLRGEQRPRLAPLGCQIAPDGVTCGVECDGGTVNLKTEGDGVRLYNNGLTLGGTCGAPQRVRWVAGPHDSDFRLSRVDGPACQRYAERMRPAFAASGRPVMDRIASGRTCFERSYSDDHLRAHPQQTVRSIRVEWDGFDREDANRGRIRISARLRSGSSSSETLTCQPEGFGIQCFPAQGDGDLAMTRAGDDAIRLSLDGQEGTLTKIGTLTLAADDKVFRITETSCR